MANADLIITGPAGTDEVLLNSREKLRRNYLLEVSNTEKGKKQARLIVCICLSYFNSVGIIPVVYK